MNIKQNFTWEETIRDLVIFIPNYKRSNYILQSLDQFQTKCDPRKYLIIVGNDGIHEEIPEIGNLRYFTIFRDNPVPRNGSFIRNYFIKRCQSRFIFQKDPETVIKKINEYYDWIDMYSNIPDLIQFIKPKSTAEITNSGKFIPQETDLNTPHRSHWGALYNTEMLKYLGGYNEKFNVYGYEDTDLMRRIDKYSAYKYLDVNIMSVHHYHPIDSSVWNEVNQMEQVYNSLDPNEIIANKYTNWGEG